MAKKQKVKRVQTLGELKPNPKNPRTITDTALEALKESLGEFGDISGIVLNKRTGRLVGGHQRQKSLPPDSKIKLTEMYSKPDSQGTVAIGWIETPEGHTYGFREVDWSVDKELAANLRANNPAGQFDSEAVAKIIHNLQNHDYNISLTGFDEKKLVQFLADVNKTVQNAAVNSRYEVIVECETEKEQQEVYGQLIAESRKCRLLTF